MFNTVLILLIHLDGIDELQEKIMNNEKYQYIYLK